jgi:glycosyltransferase involved in cell wall biosynthesis
MRIAVWHNLPSGGAKRALHHHVGGLIDRGHTVEAWCPDTAESVWAPLSDFATEHVVPFAAERARYGFVYRLIWPYADVVRQLWEADRHGRAVAGAIEGGRFDVLLAGGCRFHSAPPIARHAHLPSVLYLNEPCRALYEASPILPWRAPAPHELPPRPVPRLRALLKDRLRTAALRVQAREEYLSARAFDRILANSLFSRENILRAYGLEAHVCRLGVDTSLFRPTATGKERYVVGVGSAHEHKALERALMAVSMIPPLLRPALVWVANDRNAEYQLRVEQLARELAVELSIRLSLSDTDLVEVLSRARVMLFLPKLEPFGLAPLEANACGTAVVGIAEGGLRETICYGVNGVLAESKEPEAVAAALMPFLESDDLASRMGTSARRHVEAVWSWKGAVDSLERHLSDVANDSARRAAG